MEKKWIYADNAATTKLSAEVLADMMPYLTEIYGNPSSLYEIGTYAQKAVETAREKIAECINAHPREIYFTSGGSESDNWAIKGMARALKKKGKNHIITTAFEHHAVLHTCQALKREGFEITLLDVHENGIVRADELEKAIKDTTALVSIMYANNEIGTVQPIEELGAVCKKHNVIFHTDAVQAVGHLPIDVQKQNIDMLSMTAHKLHGPKGCGALYIRKGIRPQIYIDGGSQERGMRAGTENVAGIVGLASALQRSLVDREERNSRMTVLRNRLIDELLTIEKSRLNGDRNHRLPNNINMCFEGIEGEALLLRLDLKGICASSGSACTSGSLDPSHVLLALGLPHEIAHGSLRLSLGEDITEEDVDYIAQSIKEVVQTLRQMSPVWEKIKNSEK
ncbi:MAG: cysteine desulfurase NifS [Clostridia bacterium]|nr:cysteine desulfurase NifS [Clostridia bacterium]